MQTDAFEERAPHEKGFAKVFAERLMPVLAGFAAQRQAAWRRARIGAGAVLVLGAACIVALWLYGPQDPPLQYVLTGFAAFVTIMLTFPMVLLAGGGLDEQAAEKVGPILADFLGDATYRRRPDKDFVAVGRMVALHVVRGYDVRLQDGVEGTWRGVRYKIVEMSMRNPPTGGDGKTRRWFNGLVMEIETPVAMPTILFQPEMGLLSDMLKGPAEGRTRLAFPDPEVQAAFRVYADDPDAVWQAIRPGFGRTLLDIATAQGGETKRLSAAFEDKRFYLAMLGVRNFMAVNMYFSAPDRYPDQCRRALADLTLPRRIIDRLIGGEG